MNSISQLKINNQISEWEISSLKKEVDTYLDVIDILYQENRQLKKELNKLKKKNRK